MTPENAKLFEDAKLRFQQCAAECHKLVQAGVITGCAQSDVWDWDDPVRLRKELARLREYLHVIEDAKTLELAVNQAALALYM
jgi:hypothetical protein